MLCWFPTHFFIQQRSASRHIECINFEKKVIINKRSGLKMISTCYDVVCMYVCMFVWSRWVVGMFKLYTHSGSRNNADVFEGNSICFLCRDNHIGPHALRIWIWSLVILLKQLNYTCDQSHEQERTICCIAEIYSLKISLQRKSHVDLQNLQFEEECQYMVYIATRSNVDG